MEQWTIFQHCLDEKKNYDLFTMSLKFNIASNVAFKIMPSVYGTLFYLHMSIQ